MRALLLFSLLLLTTTDGSAQQDEWRLYKADDVTTVEYRQSDAQLLQIRAVTETDSMLSAFLHLLEDTASITNWVANSQKAELLAKPYGNTHVVHTYFSAPWPVSKRDMVTQSVWQQDAASGVLTLLISDIGEHFPPVQGYVRMQHVQGQWTLTPLGNGRIKIAYQGQADPAGKLPHFIADKVALKATLSTFRQLSQLLPQYQKPYSGISE